MELKALSDDLNVLFSNILENNIEKLFIEINEANYQYNQLLNKIESILAEIGKIWGNEHDQQGKLITDSESLSSEEINEFYLNLTPLFELIRSRIPIQVSNLRIGVGAPDGGDRSG